jgi:hypothetical protein
MGTIKSKIFTTYPTDTATGMLCESPTFGDVTSKCTNSNLSSSIQSTHFNKGEQLARSTSAHLASEVSKIRQHHQHQSIKNESTGFTITNACSTKKIIITNCSDVDLNSTTANKTNTTSDNKENCNINQTNQSKNVDHSDKEDMNVLIDSFSRNMDREKANKRFSLNIDSFNLVLGQQNGNNYVESCGIDEQETSVELLVVLNDETCAAAKLPKLIEHDVAIDCYCDEPDSSKIYDSNTHQKTTVTSFQPPTVLQKSQYFRSFRSASRRFFGGSSNLKRAAIVNAQNAGQVVSSSNKKLSDENIPSNIASRRTFKENEEEVSNKFDANKGNKNK